MERQTSSHLTDDEIQKLLASAAGLEDSASTSYRRVLELHIDDCQTCRNLLEMHRAEQNRLTGLKSNKADLRGEHCPDQAIWMDMVGSLLQPEDAISFAKHAATCDYCGHKLLQATQYITQPATDAEKRFFASSAVSQPAWQNNMVDRMTAVSVVLPSKRPPIHKRSSIVWKWAWMTVALVVLGGAVFWWNKHRTGENPENLLSKAYAERRTLELRISGAPHAPLQVRRGPEGKSSLDRPQPLIEAEAIIIRGLTTHPQDAAWIQAKGRADLLAWNYDSAITSFKQALELQSNSPDLLIDLSSAYFERAEASGHDVDYGAAFDLLGQALKARPDDPVGIFNRAVISERMGLYEQAIQDWEHYLKVDPNSEWSTEARTRLENIRKKKVGVNPSQLHWPGILLNS